MDNCYIKTFTFTGLLIVCTFLCSCKKDEAIENNSNNATTYNYTTFLYIEGRYTIINNLPYYNGRFSTAVFSKNNGGKIGGYPVNIDSVFLSNRLLKPQTNFFSQYSTQLIDTFLPGSYPPFIWKVIGSSEFPSFSETLLDSLPQFTKCNTVPDSISKSGNIVIPLGSNNADSLNVSISDGIHSQNWAKINLSSNTTSVEVANASFLSPTSSGKISIEYYKSFSKMVSDKRINYRIFSTYSKLIKITN